MPDTLPATELFPWPSPITSIAMLLLGLCIGSFLNVVIYRLPLGMKVSEPKRSFCPKCKADIPWYRNLPVITWIMQGGKCAACKSNISPRYPIIELLTGALWYLCSIAYSSPLEALFYGTLGTIALAITCIDIDHFIIPRSLTLLGTLIALTGAALMPYRFAQLTWHEGLLYAIFGILIGWVALYLIVLLGKCLFGTLKIDSDTPHDWSLREPTTEDEELTFVIGTGDEQQAFGWSELFFRKSDRLEISGIHTLLIDGSPVEAEHITILPTTIEANDNSYDITKIHSISGTATHATVPREALGMGDVDLLAMLGATFGAPALIPLVFFACLCGIIVAIIGRMGFGKHIPFGPALLAGGIAYHLFGQEMWQQYLDFVTKSAL